MDVLNRLPRKRFREVDDLFAFISIYDDSRRTRAYRSLLKKHQRSIRNAVCVEGGCGLGIFSVELARLGAKKVYAVEQNPLLARLARARMRALPRDLASRIELVESPLEKFRPPAHVNILVHEFYGQLLYDEDLWVLEHLRFQPDIVLPDGGELRAGVVSSGSYGDEVVTRDVVDQLDDVLVSGLFEERGNELRVPVLRWKFGEGLMLLRHSLKNQKGDLVCFGVVITHHGERICAAGECPNWSYVWTLRKGSRASFHFRRSGPGMECSFRWMR